MTIFEYVTVAVSIILGLAVARVLSSLTDLFIYRSQVKLHWIPVAWSAALFGLLIVNWWQLFEVSRTLPEWTFVGFALEITQVVTLYVASSLMLPRHWSEKRIDLWEWFCEQGRWGVAAYLLFFVMAIPVNSVLWGSPILSFTSLLVCVILVTGIGVMLNRSPRQTSVWTIAFVLVQLATWAYVLEPTFSST